MAANNLVKTAGYGLGDQVTAAEFQALQVQAAQSVNRNGSASGAMNYPMIPIAGITSTDAWVIQLGQLIVSNAGAGLVFALDRLPDGHVLTQIRVKMLPAGGHALQPASLPYLKIYKIALDGTATLLGTFTYSWVDVGTYETGFYLALGGLAETVSLATYRYICEVGVENGANSVYGTIIKSIEVSMTIDHAYAGADVTCWLKA